MSGYIGNTEPYIVPAEFISRLPYRWDNALSAAVKCPSDGNIWAFLDIRSQSEYPGCYTTKVFVWDGTSWEIAATIGKLRSRSFAFTAYSHYYQDVVPFFLSGGIVWAGIPHEEYGDLIQFHQEWDFENGSAFSYACSYGDKIYIGNGDYLKVYDGRAENPGWIVVADSSPSLPSGYDSCSMPRNIVIDDRGIMHAVGVTFYDQTSVREPILTHYTLDLNIQNPQWEQLEILPWDISTFPLGSSSAQIAYVYSTIAKRKTIHIIGGQWKNVDGVSSNYKKHYVLTDAGWREDVDLPINGQQNSGILEFGNDIQILGNQWSYDTHYKLAKKIFPPGGEIIRIRKGVISVPDGYEFDEYGRPYQKTRNAPIMKAWIGDSNKIPRLVLSAFDTKTKTNNHALPVSIYDPELKNRTCIYEGKIHLFDKSPSSYGFTKLVHFVYDESAGWSRLPDINWYYSTGQSSLDGVSSEQGSICFFYYNTGYKYKVRTWTPTSQSSQGDSVDLQGIILLYINDIENNTWKVLSGSDNKYYITNYFSHRGWQININDRPICGCSSAINSVYLFTYNKCYLCRNGSLVEHSTLPFRPYSCYYHEGTLHCISSVDYADYYYDTGLDEWVLSDIKMPFSKSQYSGGMRYINTPSGNLHAFRSFCNYRFDEAAGQFILAGTDPNNIEDLPYNMKNGQMVFCSDEYSHGDNKYHFFGSEIEGEEQKHYSWDGHIWTREIDLPYPFYKGSAVISYDDSDYELSNLLADGVVHIMGSGDPNHYSDHYIWWPGSTQWSRASGEAQNIANYYDGAAVCYRKEINIIGGAINNYRRYVFDDMYGTAYDEDLPYPFLKGSAIVYNDRIHIFGSAVAGYERKHYSYYEVETEGEWTEESELPYDFYNGIVVLYEDKIHIMGGEKEGTSKLHYKWDGTNWIRCDDLTMDHFGSSCFGDSFINIFGGNQFTAVEIINENRYFY